MDTATNKEAARIKVESAKADILLIAGGKDNIWNAYDGCITVMGTLAKNNYKYGYNFLAYENAGHPFPLPFIMPVGLTANMKLAPRLVFTTGGTQEDNARIQKDSWDKTTEFFKKN